MIRIIPAAAALLLLFLPVFTHAQNKAPAEMPLEAVQRVARQVMSAEPRLRKAALEALAERGDPDVVPALIQALRFFPDEGAINATLVGRRGETGPRRHAGRGVAMWNGLTQNKVDF